MLKKNVTFIGEAGQGHEGKISNIKQYIYSSTKTNFDFLKFHLIYADELATKEYKYYNFLKKLEIRKEKWVDLCKFAKNKKVNIAFDVLGEQSLDVAEATCSNLIKIHATDIYNYPLQKKINSSRFKHVILSVSGCSSSEIQTALDNLNKKNVYLMIGFQNYPTLSKSLNLKKMLSFKKKFKKKIGYADHSSNGINETIYNCSTAIGFDCNIIEKHFTFNKNKKIEDDESAINSIEFNNLIKVIDLCKINSGKSVLKLSKEENKYRKNISRSIFAKKNIKKNEIFSFENLDLKRGKTSNKLRINEILYKRSVKKIKKGSLIKKSNYR